jgi:ribosomal protein S18 acetylase RimI-like enzyme
MYSIVPAEGKDANEISALVNSAYRGDSSKAGWTTEADLLDGSRTDPALIKSLIDKPDVTLLKYVEDGQILGCVELAVSEDGLYLGMLTVKPNLQNKGIGKAMLKAAEEKARKQNQAKIIMTVISVREELINWYKRHGYVDSGKRKPFQFNDPRFGAPKQHLEFAVLEKVV